MDNTSWQNFYVIVGSSAGALTGLQFVIIALITQTKESGNMRDIRAFGTPTVVHFCTALMISALLVMPWRDSLGLGICLGIYGAAGVVYCLRVVAHSRMAAYRPDLEDRVWYLVFPVLAHLILLIAAALFVWNLAASLFTIAGDALLFLFLGIHNAWDTVTYISVKHGKRLASQDQSTAG